jgi:vacuolar-type H+-ATPase subunit I/STV1
MIDNNNIMKKLAIMQTENRNYKQDVKRYTQMLIERDEKINELKKEYEAKITKLKDEMAFKDRMLKELRPKPKIRKVKNDK